MSGEKNSPSKILRENYKSRHDSKQVICEVVLSTQYKQELHQIIKYYFRRKQAQLLYNYGCFSFQRAGNLPTSIES